MSRRFVFVWLVLVFPVLSFAQPTPFERAKLPFGTAADASRLRSTMGLRHLRKFFENHPRPQSAPDHFLTAELLKQLGDFRAVHYYERAIAIDPDEPAYELFFADYLRNFRGPRRPLFAEAEEHYFEALGKLRRRGTMTVRPHEQRDFATYLDMVRDRIDRGLVALYQEDGAPLAWRESGKPLLFLSAGERAARSTADLDEVHDTRDFSAEALLASARLKRPLTEDELRAVVRIKEPVAASERLRFRLGAGPVFDLFHRSRDIGAAQITAFDKPTVFNDVDLQVLGAGIEQTFALRASDLHLRAAYSSLQRTGVIEGQPRAGERIDQLDLQAAASRFIGPDKLILEIVRSLQAIDPEIPNPPDRSRRITGVNVEYQVLRPLSFLRDPYGQLFNTRGIAFSAGFAADTEKFGAVDVTRHDYFIGTSVKGIGRFDFTVQPTWIDSDVSDDLSQANEQFRTDATILVRLLDEEREPGIPITRLLGLHPAFAHLVFSYKHDALRDGPRALENQKLGVAFSAKFFRRSLSPSALQNAGTSRARPATILFSVRYDRQRFPRLDEELDLFFMSISLGY